ncbi:hypothetical protein [Billgrantia desiderata]|uniref:hypothetical protein n=1 Tax=Billgrantia desiderata TaxID=52021 RepID=UPI001F3E14D1|nr:hypothetical protein [Halomonas desiderata]MCE8014346.1 hypothetical protein [Halomonas desiderata]
MKRSGEKENWKTIQVPPTRVLLASLGAVLLAGCDSGPSQVQVEVGSLDTIDSSRPLEVLFLSEDDVEGMRSLGRFISSVDNYLASSRDGNSVGVDEYIEFPSHQDEALSALRASLERYDATLSNADVEWQAHLSEIISPLEVSLEDARQRKTEVEGQLSSWDEITQSERDVIEALEAQIREHEEKAHSLREAVVEAWNEYILENDLAVRTLSGTNNVYYHNFQRTTNECREDSRRLVIDRRSEDESCYYLWLPNAELNNLEASRPYVEGFPEYLELMTVLGRDEGSLRHQLQQARVELRNAEIRAENRLGTRWTLENQVRQIEQEIRRVESRIEREQGEHAERQFRSQQTRELVSQVTSQQRAYADRRARDLLNQVNKASFSPGEPVDIEGSPRYLAAIIPFGHFFGSGSAISFLDMEQEFDENPIVLRVEENNTRMIGNDSAPHIPMVRTIADVEFYLRN